MSKAAKELECFECKKTIEVGQDYTKKIRYDNPTDASRQAFGVSKDICQECISQNKYSFIDEKYKNPTVVKFGLYTGKSWSDVPDEYLIYHYSHDVPNKYREEIVNEYTMRLLKNESVEINPVSDENAQEHILSLQKKLLDIKKTKNKPQLTKVMKLVYLTLLQENDKIKRMDYDYNSHYWLFLKTVDLKVGTHSKRIDQRTIASLFEKGLLKPTKFKDNIKKRTTEVIEYEAILDSRIS